MEPMEPWKKTSSMEAEGILASSLVELVLLLQLLSGMALMVGWLVAFGAEGDGAIAAEDVVAGGAEGAIGAAAASTDLADGAGGAAGAGWWRWWW